MKIRDEAEWARGLENNTDPYGAAIYQYAERWADLMEARMAAGEALEACVKETSHQADAEGITGFMYGAAVATLSWAWEHGEELRKWHNIDTQIGAEGEAANESGGVLNPAILNLGVKK